MHSDELIIASATQLKPSVNTTSLSSINNRLSSTSLSSTSPSTRPTPPAPTSRPSSIGPAPRPDASALAKKRKADAEPLTEADRERERRKKLLMEKMKSRGQAQQTGKAGSAPPPARGAAQPAAKPAAVSSTKTSSSSVPPPKPTEVLSYKERLARAAKQQEEKKHLGVIMHKARAPVVEKKEWQKKLEAQKARQQVPAKAAAAVPERKSKSPGLVAGDKPVVGKRLLAKDTAKPGLARKVEPDSRRSSVTNPKGKPVDKGKLAEPIKRKRSPSPISWRGRNASSAPAKKPSRPKNGKSRYDEDDEDDDDSWIVDDDEDEDAGRDRQSSYSRR